MDDHVRDINYFMCTHRTANWWPHCNGCLKNSRNSLPETISNDPDDAISARETKQSWRFQRLIILSCIFDWNIFRLPSKLSRWPQISLILLEFLIDYRRSLFQIMSRFWSWSEYSEHLSIEFCMGKRIEISSAHRLLKTITVSSIENDEIWFFQVEQSKLDRIRSQITTLITCHSLGRNLVKIPFHQNRFSVSHEKFQQISFISYTKFNEALMLYTCTSITINMHNVNKLNACGLNQRRLQSKFSFRFDWMRVKCVCLWCG